MGEPAGTDRILTIPNLISLLRIALIPVFVALIVDHDTTQLGLAPHPARAARAKCARKRFGRGPQCLS